MSSGPEYPIQVTLYRYLKQVLPQAFVHAVENAHAPRSDDPGARMNFHAKRKAKGIRNGVPDLTAILPGPRLVYVEVKAPGGVVSVAQQDVHAELRQRGCVVIVADAIESCRLGLNDAGVALREAAGQPTRVAKVRFEKAKASIDMQGMPF